MATSLEKRIAQLEAARVKSNLKAMTDEELDRNISTLEVGSPAFYDAVIARVLRRRSAFPVVVDDPEHAGGWYDIH